MFDCDGEDSIVCVGVCGLDFEQQHLANARGESSSFFQAASVHNTFSST